MKQRRGGIQVFRTYGANTGLVMVLFGKVAKSVNCDDAGQMQYLLVVVGTANLKPLVSGWGRSKLMF
jgi:hypothetical protein